MSLFFLSAGIKQACPEGVFVSLTPDNPALWAGVLFVREGPYAPAVLRFQITFPDAYPKLPPLIAFTTDMFHPLITPLTTYMYTTDIQDNGTVSATDAERLPPGGFSLRHGFPEWFGRGRKSSKLAPNEQGVSTPGPSVAASTPASEVRSAASTNGAVPSFMDTTRKAIPLYDVLRYMKSTFCEEDVLDNLPLDAAGNPGAWHAWRTHRKKQGKLADGKGAEEDTNHADDKPEEAPEEEAEEKAEEPAAEKPAAPPQTPSKQAASAPQQARDHREWNWDGVWELRVRKGIAASLSEPVLYGGATTGAGDDVVSYETHMGHNDTNAQLFRSGSRLWTTKMSKTSKRISKEHWKETSDARGWPSEIRQPR